MPSEVWDETYPYPNFNGCTIEVRGWINNFIPHITDNVNYLSMLESNSISVQKKKCRLCDKSAVGTKLGHIAAIDSIIRAPLYSIS